MMKKLFKSFLSRKAPILLAGLGANDAHDLAIELEIQPQLFIRISRTIPSVRAKRERVSFECRARLSARARAGSRFRYFAGR